MDTLCGKFASKKTWPKKMTNTRKTLVCWCCVGLSLAAQSRAHGQERIDQEFYPIQQRVSKSTEDSIALTQLPKMVSDSDVQPESTSNNPAVPSKPPLLVEQPPAVSKNSNDLTTPKLERLSADLELEFLNAYGQKSSGSGVNGKLENAKPVPTLGTSGVASIPSGSQLNFAIANPGSSADSRDLDLALRMAENKVEFPNANERPDSANAIPHHDLGMSSDKTFDLRMQDNDPVWWSQKVTEGILPENSTQPIDLNSLVFQAIKNSPRIQAISQTPLIRELQVIEADSAFDAVGFVRSNFNDRNDPVGNTLVTGGPPFLEDHIWSGDFGVKRKTRTGADVELGQKLGFQNSNSRFFLPQDQGTATLALNISQPLLRGRGRFVNESQIFIAQANHGAAWNVFSNELQDELEKVAQAYWQLYYDRSLYLQKKRSVERGQQILDILVARQDLDSMPSQVARARSAVESRKTQLANAHRDIRNSETEIRRLVADRDWMAAQSIELIPNEQAPSEPTIIPLEHIVHTAMEYRPEIKEAMQRAKIAGIQNQIGENDLLPELSLLVGGYVSALNGESGVLNSWDDQFHNRPGYNAGINFEMPYGNRAARSRLSQNKLQLAKIKAEVEESIQKVIAESQIAQRRVASAIQTRDSAVVSIEASQADLEQQASRWEQFGLVEGDFSEGQNPVILLNQVLDAQERLAAAELIYAQSDLELKVSQIALQRTMGTLLMYQNVNFSSSAERDLPYMHIDQVDVSDGN